jgi:hypothetical protein
MESQGILTVLCWVFKHVLKMGYNILIVHFCKVGRNTKQSLICLGMILWMHSGWYSGCLVSMCFDSVCLPIAPQTPNISVCSYNQSLRKSAYKGIAHGNIESRAYNAITNTVDDYGFEIWNDKGRNRLLVGNSHGKMPWHLPCAVSATSHRLIISFHFNSECHHHHQ